MNTALVTVLGRESTSHKIPMDVHFFSSEAFYSYALHRWKDSKDFPSCVFLSCFFMVHDARWGCWYSETKLVGQKQVILPFF